MERTIKSRYDELSVDRQEALDKARKASKLTVYGLIPEDDTPTPSNQHKNSYSSFGSKAVGVLASKLVYSLLPPSQDFFREDIDTTQFSEKELEQYNNVIQGDETVEEAIRSVIIKNGEMIKDYFEESGVRATYNETLENLIVAGNVVVKYTETGCRNYNLNNFVIVRDNEDNIINELITRENIDYSELTDEEMEKISNEYGDMPERSDNVAGNLNNSYELYTHIKLVDGQYEIMQEIEGVMLEDEPVIYDIDELPFVAPRMYKRSDQNYGESYVYRFYDDLRDLNNYRKYFIKGSESLTKIIYLVDPKNSAIARNMSKAKTGQFIPGKEGDVTQLQPQNLAQIQELRNMIYEIKEDLKESFLMLNVRQSERTTAEEVRQSQEENDVQLGGVFSTLSQELQLPTIKAVKGILKETNSAYVDIPHTKNRIVTGVEAIGRTQETQALRNFVNLLLEASQAAPGVLDYANEEWLVNQTIKASGVSDQAILKSSEVARIRQAKQQQAQQQMMNEQMLQSGGKMLEESVKGNQNG